MLTEKKTHNLKVEHNVSFGGLAEDLSPGGSLSDALRGRSVEVRGEPGSTGVFPAKARESDHQKITVD